MEQDSVKLYNTAEDIERLEQACLEGGVGIDGITMLRLLRDWKGMKERLDELETKEHYMKAELNEQTEELNEAGRRIWMLNETIALMKKTAGANLS